MNREIPPSSTPDNAPEKEPISDEQVIEALKKGVDDPETKALWTEWVRQEQEKAAEAPGAERSMSIGVNSARILENAGMIDQALTAWEDVQLLAANSDNPELWDTAQEAIERLQKKRSGNS
ncbi:MAG: hypothetical protein AAB490_06060 [Patescibacteria group bacterium]